MTNENPFRNITVLQLEETKSIELQYIHDEKGGMLRDERCIRERWVRFFRALLNAKSNKLDSEISKRLPQQLVASALETESTAEEAAQ